MNVFLYLGSCYVYKIGFKFEFVYVKLFENLKDIISNDKFGWYGW